MATPDMSKYAERLTLVVRRAPQERSPEPAFSQAAVARFFVGDDGGEVPFEETQPTVMEWQMESGFAGWSEVENRQRNFNIGAAGADAVVIVTLLGGMAEGSTAVATEAALRAVIRRFQARGRSELRPRERVVEVDELWAALAQAIDRRRSELELVDFRSDAVESQAVFDDRDGVRWEIKSARDLFEIRRL